MDQDDVDAVETQPLEARVERAADSVGREVEVGDLVRHVAEHAGRDRASPGVSSRPTFVDTTISSRGRDRQRLAQTPFGEPMAVERSGVEHPDAAVECRVDGRPCVFVADRRVQVAERGGAEAEPAGRTESHGL